MEDAKTRNPSSPNANPWTEAIPDDQWSVYQKVIAAARAQGLHFALGGAFAVATYTGRWRNTKDLDFYVLPQDREAMIAAVTSTGMQDYYDQLPYDRSWIYRAHHGDIIVDVIWAMANTPIDVDEAWLARGPQIDLRGELLPIIPPEELIWAKLFVLQKDRSDWPDVFNLLYATGPQLDWEHLLARLGAEEAPLLIGALNVFAWLSPHRARQLPTWLWDRLRLPVPDEDPLPEATMRWRAALLDSRPWFIPVIPEDEEPFSPVA